MDRLDIGLLTVVATFLLMLIRVPVGISMIATSFVGITFIVGWNGAWGILSTIPYSFVATWELSAVPTFLFMGYVAARGGLTNGLFASMRILFNWVPGNLAIASVAASALFAAASGSSSAASAALTRIAVPEMLRANYQVALATGTIAAAGTLGSLIPPSIIMVVYGVFTNTPVGPLFMAGIIPGIFTAVAFSIMIIVRVRARPDLAPRASKEFTPAETRAAIMDVWPLPLLIFAVLGSIMTGTASPTEAGALGAVVAVIIVAVRGSFTRGLIWESLTDAARATATIFFIALGAAIFQRLMGLSQLPSFLSEGLLSISDNVYIIILMIAVVYIVLGMFLEAIGIMLLTLPIIMPLLTALDVNMIWFGILAVKLLEMGMVTPPLGLNVYIVKSSLGDEVSLTTIFRGSMWFVGTDIIVFAILVAFPALSLWLPGLM